MASFLDQLLKPRNLTERLSSSAVLRHHKDLSLCGVPAERQRKNAEESRHQCRQDQQIRYCDSGEISAGMPRQLSYRRRLAEPSGLQVLNSCARPS